MCMCFSVDKNKMELDFWWREDNSPKLYPKLMLYLVGHNPKDLCRLKKPGYTVCFMLNFLVCRDL